MVKSRAAQKFLANHPVQHQNIANMAKSAKPTRSKFQWQSEEDQISDEWANMMRNQKIVRLREEDLTSDWPCKRQNIQKKVTWSENLVEVHNITENQAEEVLTDEVCDIILPNVLQPSISKISRGKLAQGQQNISRPDETDLVLSSIQPQQNIPETESSNTLERIEGLLGTSKQEEKSLKFSFLINCDNNQKDL